jgi:hypothetical protein
VPNHPQITHNSNNNNNEYNKTWIVKHNKTSKNVFRETTGGVQKKKKKKERMQRTVEFPASQFSSAESHREVDHLADKESGDGVRAINDRSRRRCVHSDVSVPRYARGIIYPLVLVRSHAAADHKSLLISDRRRRRRRRRRRSYRDRCMGRILFSSPALPHRLFTRSLIYVPQS